MLGTDENLPGIHPLLPTKIEVSHLGIMLKKTTFLLLASIGSGLANAATVDLDLKSALDRAPEANFQILLSEEGLAAQEQATRIARSGIFPQVSLEASQGRSMNPTVDAFSSSFPGVKKHQFVLPTEYIAALGPFSGWSAARGSEDR